MASGSMKDIKRRIKSIESTKQITKAMELVASSKLRKAKERAEQSQPFFSTLYSTICDIASMNDDFNSVYTKKRDIKNTLYIVIAGDRGLAGGYNANILKLADKSIYSTDTGSKVMAIGKKAVEYYAKRNLSVASFPYIAEDVDRIQVTRIANIAVNMYKSGEVDQVIVYYTQFVSALSQVATELKVLPLTDIKSDIKTSAVPIYEPSAESVFNSIVPDYIAGILYGSVVESFASEQGARRTAMESASDNATEMIDKLSLQYNRARQAAITQEISEIVSGAGALN
ncbi:MAG: ATP synthase F1 subunit gamma [Oscillospiraceae bacterium]